MATAGKRTDSELVLQDWQGADRSRAAKYLDKRLAEAGSNYKSVAFATFLLTTMVAGFCWLLFGVVLDHWWIAGGMPVWIRWTWLLIGTLGVGAIAWKWLVPILRYQVNVLYAARSIEQEFPELHNDLVNAILVNPGETDPHKDLITRSLDKRAARQMITIPTDTVIDQQHLVSLAVVLACLVFVGTVYSLFSPKSPFVTAARLLAPWSGWAAPSRVSIKEVNCYWTTVFGEGKSQHALPPGDYMFDGRQHLLWQDGGVELIRGRQVVLSAEIDHLRDAEIPSVMVSSLLDNGKLDPEVKPWKASLRKRLDSQLYWARLPSSGIGLDRSIRVRIEAGDARTEPFDVRVVDAPSLLVKEVRYIFPGYTDQPDQIVQWQGDLRAIEGTEVRVEVKSNQALDAAWVDFLNTDRLDDLRLVVDRTNPKVATGVLRLRLAADRILAEHPTYRLRFRPQSESGTTSAPLIDELLTHRIEVFPDLAPEVAIELPESESERMPSRSAMRVRVRSIDPDYSLSKVVVETRPEGAGLIRDKVLWQFGGSDNQVNGDGEVRVSTRIVPTQDAPGAKIIEYRAVVYDNREPEPNSTATKWRRLIIDEQSPPPKDPEERWPDKKPEQPQQTTPSRDVSDSQSDKQSLKDTEREPDEIPEQQDLEEKNKDQQPRSEEMSRNQAEEKDQDASGAAGSEEGQGRQSGSSAEDNTGGRSGETQANDGRSESSSGSSRETQQSGSRENSNDQAVPGGNDAGMESDSASRSNSREQQNEDSISGEDASSRDSQDQQQNDSKGDRDAMETKSLSSDGVDDGEAMERILKNKQCKSSGEKSGGEKSGGEKSGGEKSGGEKSGGEKSGGEKSGGEKSGGEKSGGEKSGGEKTGGEKSGGEKSGGEKSGGEKSGGEKSGGEKSGGEKSGGEPGAEGGGSGGNSEQSGREGTESSKNGGSMSAGSDSGRNEKNSAMDSSDGQSSESAPGSDSPINEGGMARPARENESDNKSSSTDQQPALSASDSETSTESSTASQGRSGSEKSDSGAGGTSGGQRGLTEPQQKESVPEVLDSKPQELSAVRQATDLALDHLRDSIRSTDDDMLRELGWTRKQAEAFLRRWENMQKSADNGSQGQQRAYEQTLRSLGLRTDRVRTSRTIQEDQKGVEVESRRTQPPYEYRERFKAFLKGASSRQVDVNE